MASDGQIVFEVTADGKHAIADIKEITRAIQTETGKWDQAAKQSTDGITNNFSGMLKKLAAGFSAVKIGKALLDLGQDALQAASDLQEVQNVVDVTFGENANQIEKWAKNAGTQFGLTETQAKKFSSTMGAMLKSSGLAGEQIVDVSTDLAGLAADMASFYNLDFEEAFSKIRSGISGQTMPLKELGIDMSVATLNAFALQKGLDKTFDKMSQGEQTMLRYQYLMSATADAQGDFARTSDGYANSMRKLQTNVDALKTSLGTPFINVVAGAVGELNKFIEALMPDESKKTVLEKLNDIDIDTQSKLADIQKVADEANGLIDKLSVISGTDAGDALKTMAEGANKLNSSSPKTWSSLLGTLKDVDGLSNVFDSNSGQGIESLAAALSGTDLDTNKADAWRTFLGALAENADEVSKLTGESAESTKQWLEGLAESVNSIDANDAEAWDKLLTTLVTGLAGNTPEGQKFIEGLASQFLSLGTDSEEAVKGLQALGFSSDQITDKQEAWLKTCKDLVRTIPGLSDIINTETGEVKGGVGALDEYVKEWKIAQEKIVYWKAFYAKKAAQEEAQNSLYNLEIEAGGAKKAAERAKKAYEDAFEKIGGESGENAIFLKISNAEATEAERNAYSEVVKTRAKLKQATEAQTEAENNHAQAVKDNAEAIQKLADEEEWLTEKYGEAEEEVKTLTTEMTLLEKAADGDEDALKKVTTAVDNANTALQEMANYVQGVHDSVRSSIDSTVNGFGEVKTPMMEAKEKVKDLTGQLNKLGERTKKNADEWDKLNEEINKTESSKISAQRMAKNLEQQADYMDEYLKNLEKASKKGVSDEVLAQLSDGSEESFDYLAELAKASPKEVEKINKNFEKVAQKKKELEDRLSKQKLTVDDVYKTIAEKAKAAVAELDLEEEAKNKSGKTVQGIAEGISAHVTEVTDAVDSIVAQLDRLSGYGFSVNLGNFGTFGINLGGGKNKKTEGAFAGGIDYVPHDMYARIHEGEGVLKAEENAVYQSVKNGLVAGFDLDALGGVMRDNVKAGGNVYLDGKAVGNVISDRQGRSYKSLQRSGWQA